MRIATTLLVFCVAALAALGLVMITSACIGMESAKYAKYLHSHAFYLGLALVICPLMAGPDYQWLRKVQGPL